MQDTSKKNIAELFDDRQGMDRALARAVRRAVLNHKRTGNPVATWCDGKVVWLQPDEIEIPDDDIWRDAGRAILTSEIWKVTNSA